MNCSKRNLYRLEEIRSESCQPNRIPSTEKLQYFRLPSLPTRKNPFIAINAFTAAPKIFYKLTSWPLVCRAATWLKLDLATIMRGDNLPRDIFETWSLCSHGNLVLILLKYPCLGWYFGWLVGGSTIKLGCAVNKHTIFDTFILASLRWMLTPQSTFD